MRPAYDIAPQYISSRGFHPSEPDCYVFSRRPARFEGLGSVTRLEDYLFRIERPR